MERWLIEKGSRLEKLQKGERRQEYNIYVNVY